MQLTAEQSTVAAHDGGHAVVAAVAGSGKSATMIERIGKLLEKGVDHRRILTLLFNKSARDDFDSRLRARFPDSPVPEVFTYHAFGLRLCAALGKTGTLPVARLETSDFAIRQLARGVLIHLNESLSEQDQFDTGSEATQEFLDQVDLLKSCLFDGETLPPGCQEIPERVVSGYLAFESAREAAGLRTFTDLVTDPVRLAIADADVAAFISNRYDHLIVDEFQDINESQMMLVRLIAGTRAQVMAVGDDDQTIYVWRGARPDYMTHRFMEIFPDAKRYALTNTFRYGPALSAVANSVIRHNTTRIQKSCISALPIDTSVQLQMHTDNPGQYVADELRRWVRQGRSLQDVSVLVREYANTVPVEVALQREGIPYRLEGAPPFVERPESMAIRAYLQFALPGGLAAVDDFKHRRALLLALTSLPTLYLRREEQFELCSNLAERPSQLLATAPLAFKAMSRGGKAFAIDRRLDAVDTWRWCSQFSAGAPAARFLLELYRRTKLFSAIAKQNTRKEIGDDKIRLLQSLVRLAESGRHTVASFSSYLQEISARQSDGNPEAALVTSIHRAKGMEWKLVVMPDLADALFPGSNASDDIDTLEGERRLFYVGLTRAMERVLLLAPFDPELVRWSVEKHEKLPPLDKIKASRFLYEARLTP